MFKRQKSQTYKQLILEQTFLYNIFIFSSLMAKILIPNNTNNCIHKVITYDKSEKQYCLFLGSYEAANNPSILEEYKIRAILTVASDLSINTKLCHKIVQIDDNPHERISDYFSEANAWLVQNLLKGNVLVHCRAGISRSAAIVIAFLMNSKKYKLRHAFDKVKEKRSIICPNEGFMEQLKVYERKLKKTLESKGLKLK